MTEQDKPKKKQGRPPGITKHGEPTTIKTIRATPTFFKAWLDEDFRAVCEKLARETKP